MAWSFLNIAASIIVHSRNMLAENLSQLEQCDIAVHTQLKLTLEFSACPKGICDLQAIEIGSLVYPIMALDPSIAVLFRILYYLLYQIEVLENLPLLWRLDPLSDGSSDRRELG